MSTQVRKVRGPLLDTLYARLMRCGNLTCTGKPFTEHRNIPDLRPDPADPRLEWEQAADRVRAAIRSGQLASSDTLPSVPDLARLQGLKPGTVRHMFLALAEEGLVHIRHGRTTTIAGEPPGDEPGTRLVLPGVTGLPARVKGCDVMAAGRDAERPALALFAAELRAARGHAGLSREDLAVKLNYSASLVGMIETERRTPSRDFAARCDEVFDTPGTFTRLEERLHDLPYPASFRPFAGYEAEARSLRMFEHVLVPGLLQTPEYARAVLATRPRITADELEALVAARLARQVVLDRKDPPLLWVLLDEGCCTGRWARLR